VIFVFLLFLTLALFDSRQDDKKPKPLLIASFHTSCESWHFRQMKRIAQRIKAAHPRLRTVVTRSHISVNEAHLLGDKLTHDLGELDLQPEKASMSCARTQTNANARLHLPSPCLKSRQ